MAQTTTPTGSTRSGLSTVVRAKTEVGVMASQPTPQEPIMIRSDPMRPCHRLGAVSSSGPPTRRWVSGKSPSRRRSPARAPEGAPVGSETLTRESSPGLPVCPPSGPPPGQVYRWRRHRPGSRAPLRASSRQRRRSRRSRRRRRGPSSGPPSGAGRPARATPPSGWNSSRGPTAGSTACRPRTGMWPGGPAARRCRGTATRTAGRRHRRPRRRPP
ncbi:hypothetical protein ACFFX0_01910 [Citricoccus parietis]|uniref:Uncharacterized protein n=1 Tax=Citricoccus parietis TaxID=592307 RepID=A0ABV5FTN0_9MICC